MVQLQRLDPQWRCGPFCFWQAVFLQGYALKANVVAVGLGSEFRPGRDLPEPRATNLNERGSIMTSRRKIWLGLMGLIAAAVVTSTPAIAQQSQRTNIIFIMGDDIGWS